MFQVRHKNLSNPTLNSDKNVRIRRQAKRITRIRAATQRIRQINIKGKSQLRKKNARKHPKTKTNPNPKVIFQTTLRRIT
jgi:hypothetical protein